MMFAEFRVYVQFDETPEGRYLHGCRISFGRASETSMASRAVEVEPPKGSVQNPTERHLIVTGGSTQLM